MRIPKQFSIGVLLVAVSVFCGFLAGRQNGYESGLSEWQSLPTETSTYSARGIVGTDANTKRKLAELILDIKTNVIPEFCTNDPKLSIAAHPDGGIIVQGNVVVQEIIARHLRELEMKKLLDSSNGKLSETAVLRYAWARDTYFEMKDIVGE